MSSKRTARYARVLAVTAATLTAIAASGTPRPWFLLNATPSEPTGLYVRSSAPPIVGRLIAFPAPASAFPYADRRLGYLRQVPMLKAVGAGPGDLVCTISGRLAINGRDQAPIAAVDGEGRALPHWRGCRRIGPDELFVYSNRVPNSFDSRYFGPIAKATALAVYTPVAFPWSPR